MCSSDLTHFEHAFHHSTIADHSPYEQWLANGATTAEQRANRVWKQMLEDYEDPGIDPGTDEALLAFCAQRRQTLTDDVLEE